MTTSAPRTRECTCDVPSDAELDRGRLSFEFESIEFERGRPGLRILNQRKHGMKMVMIIEDIRRKTQSKMVRFDNGLWNCEGMMER